MKSKDFVRGVVIWAPRGLRAPFGARPFRATRHGLAAVDKVGIGDDFCARVVGLLSLRLEEAQRCPPTLQPWSALVRVGLRRWLLPYDAELTAAD
jgi:hypothetical protein